MRDEDVEYYLKQLEDMAKLFDESLPAARGRAYFYNSQNVILFALKVVARSRGSIGSTLMFVLFINSSILQQEVHR